MFHPSRIVPLIAMMVALILIYLIHPVVGWATLAALAVGTVVARRRKASKVAVVPPTY